MEMVSECGACFSRPWIALLGEFLLDIIHSSSGEDTFISLSLIVSLRGPSHYHSIAAQSTNVAAPNENLFVQLRSNRIRKSSIVPRSAIPAESNLSGKTSTGGKGWEVRILKKQRQSTNNPIILLYSTNLVHAHD